VNKGAILNDLNVYIKSFFCIADKIIYKTGGLALFFRIQFWRVQGDRKGHPGLLNLDFEMAKQVKKFRAFLCPQLPL
jgi:hypothetical protein